MKREKRSTERFAAAPLTVDDAAVDNEEGFGKDVVNLCETAGVGAAKNDGVETGAADVAAT